MKSDGQKIAQILPDHRRRTRCKYFRIAQLEKRAPRAGVIRFWTTGIFEMVELPIAPPARREAIPLEFRRVVFRQ